MAQSNKCMCGSSRQNCYFSTDTSVVSFNFHDFLMLFYKWRTNNEVPNVAETKALIERSLNFFANVDLDTFSLKGVKELTNLAQKCASQMTAMIDVPLVAGWKIGEFNELVEKYQHFQHAGMDRENALIWSDSASTAPGPAPILRSENSNA